MSIRLIIDTDTAGDDALSIILALRTPGVMLEAITICNGNVDFAQQVENALYTLEVAGASGSVPVYPGCPRPLIRPVVDAAEFFGRDGMSDANFPRAAQRPESKHAVDAIIERVMAAPGEIDIVAQAPLTNIAAACVKEPRLARAVRRLWVMGGMDNSIGNTTPASEFNFFVDPEAAKIVMAAGFNLILSTWTLTMSYGVMPGERLTEIAAIRTPLAEFFMRINRVPLERTAIRYGQALSTHPDSLTCACAIDGSLIQEEVDCLVDVETQGELTRGFSSVCVPNGLEDALSDPLWPAGAPNARVLRKVDTARFADMMIAALS